MGTMKYKYKRVILYVLVATLVIAAGLVFLIKSETPVDSTTSVADGQGIALPANDKSDTIENQIDRNNERRDFEEPASLDQRQQLIKLTQDFYAAPTALEADEIVRQLYALGSIDEAQELEETLARMCPINERQTRNERQEWIAEKLNGYCRSFSLNPEEYIEARERRRLRVSQDLAEIRSQFEGLTPDQQNELFWDLIANATSWQELDAIKSFTAVLEVDQVGDGSREWILDLGQADYFTGRRGRELQRSALDLYQCEFLGSGCGPNNMRTLELCAMSNLCSPGWTVQDYYLNTLSPIELEQVENILIFIRRLGG